MISGCLHRLLSIKLAMANGTSQSLSTKIQEGGSDTEAAMV